MKTFILILALASALVSTGCSDASSAKRDSRGEPHLIELYSGGVKVREWVSTGMVVNEINSAGYFFMDAETNGLIEVSGDVVISRQLLD